jgi:hypothetical protein
LEPCLQQKENIEKGMSNVGAIWQRKNFIIHNSLFDIRYSFQTNGKFIILELTTAEEPAKHFPIIQFAIRWNS